MWRIRIRENLVMMEDGEDEDTVVMIHPPSMCALFAFRQQWRPQCRHARGGDSFHGFQGPSLPFNLSFLFPQIHTTRAFGMPFWYIKPSCAMCDVIIASYKYAKRIFFPFAGLQVPQVVLFILFLE